MNSDTASETQYADSIQHFTIDRILLSKNRICYRSNNYWN